jgi:hypothetical protein
MKPQSISRREFLKTSAATVAFAAATSPNLFAAESYGGNKIPFGLQLYSVRNECAKDLDGTVKAVAKMGYKAVEFAGYHGRDSKSCAPCLTTWLKCCGTHIGLTRCWRQPAQDRRVTTLGNKFLIVPSLPGKYTKTHQGWLDAADASTKSPTR